MRNRRIISIFIVFVCTLAIMLAKNQFSYLLLGGCNYGMETLVRQGSVNNLFVGSSTFRQGLDIDVLEEALGSDVYILTYNGNQPYTEYMQVKKLIDKGMTIKNLYVDMYAYTLCRHPSLDDDKMLMEFTIPEKVSLYKQMSDKGIGLLWQMFVSSNNVFILTWPLNKRIINTYFQKGATLTKPAGISKDEYECIQPSGDDGIIDSVQIRAIDELISVCNENEINIIFLETPKAENIMSDATYMDIMDRYVLHLTDMGVDYIRYTADEMIYSDFTDGIHPSYDGRKKYTGWLAENVLNRF